MKFSVDVSLAITRPPTAQRTARVTLDSCCAMHAELSAISMACQIHRAEMPVGSVVVDWEE